MPDRAFLERSLAFLDAQQRLVADRAEAVDGGTALVTESLPRVWDLNVLVADPDAGAGARYTERLGARDFAAPAGGPYGASCRLYSHEATAEIDEVGALTEHRARGLASGVVPAALEAG